MSSCGLSDVLVAELFAHSVELLSSQLHLLHDLLLLISSGDLRWLLFALFASGVTLLSRLFVLFALFQHPLFDEERRVRVLLEARLLVVAKRIHDGEVWWQLAAVIDLRDGLWPSLCCQKL